MGSMSATVNGWKTRNQKTWFASGWTACSKTPGTTPVASCPTTTSGGSSTNMYTTIIKVTMPSSSSIGSIDRITISFKVVDNSYPSNGLYGSLRTVDNSTSSTTLGSYRTYVAGGSDEASCWPGSSSYSRHEMTFYGSFDPGASYYLWLYTYSTDDQYVFQASSSDYTCTISYSAVTYRVSYNANGGSGAPSSGQYEYNETCTVSSTVPKRNGSSSSTEFTITGNANGGDSNTSVTASKTVSTSYTFLGWATSSGSSSVAYVGGSTFAVTGNVTLYAVWSSSTSTTYSNNSLADLPQPTRGSVSADYVLTLKPNNGEENSTINVSKSGTYRFKSWTDAAGTELSMSKTYTSSTTVYATWSTTTADSTTVYLPTPEKVKATTGSYVVTLNPSGGNVSPTSLTANIGTSYLFMGWSTTNSVNNVVSNPYTVTATTTLTAIWESYSYTDSVTLPSAFKEGLRFTGWTEVANSGEFVANPYTPTKNITLYANYKAGRNIKPFICHNNKWYRVMVDDL